jgi:heme exporter protein CcmD
MSAFFSMGGYAAFVWPCYLLTAVAMALIGYTSWKKAKRSAEILASLNDQDQRY